MPIHRYYPSKLSKEEKDSLLRGDTGSKLGVREWTSKDVEDNARFSELIRSHGPKDEHTLPHNSNSPMDNGETSYFSLNVANNNGNSPYSSGGSTPNTTTDSGNGETRKKSTFDEFLSPHISGVGEAYRGAQNAQTLRVRPQHKKRLSSPFARGKIERAEQLGIETGMENHERSRSEGGLKTERS